MIFLLNPHAASPRQSPQPLHHGRFHLPRLINLLETPVLQLIHLEDLLRHRLARSHRPVEMMKSTTHLTTLLHLMVCPQFPPVGALRLLHPLLRSQ
jgi:hypothetical protein